MSIWQIVSAVSTGIERERIVTGVGHLDFGVARLQLQETEVIVEIDGDTITGVRTVKEGRARVVAFSPASTDFPVRLEDQSGGVVALGLLGRLLHPRNRVRIP